MNIVDTHVHFWDLRLQEVSYPWLEPGVLHPIIGNIDGIKSTLYDPDAFWAECRFSGVTTAVHVEAAARSVDPLGEVKWLLQLPKHAQLTFAIVAQADLGAETAHEHIGALKAIPEVRGVRDFGLFDYFRSPEAHPGFESGVASLDGAGLLLDLDCAWEEMAAAKRLAEAHPDLPIVLEHVGYPHRRDDAYFHDWNKAVRALATAENVYCKISGLGMTDRNFTTASLQRWVETCIEAFGPRRCLFGSNFPLDRIASSYDALIDVLFELISPCTSDEQEAICNGTARQLYRL